MKRNSRQLICQVLSAKIPPYDSASTKSKQATLPLKAYETTEWIAELDYSSMISAMSLISLNARFRYKIWTKSEKHWNKKFCLY